MDGGTTAKLDLNPVGQQSNKNKTNATAANIYYHFTQYPCSSPTRQTDRQLLALENRSLYTRRASNFSMTIDYNQQLPCDLNPDQVHDHRPSPFYFVLVFNWY